MHSPRRGSSTYPPGTRWAGTGGNVLIAGFVIGGTTSKTVLIRGSGPALGAFAVTGTLPDPQIQLFLSNGSSSTLIQSNTGWAGDPQIAVAASSVQAFSWGSSATPDSAILVTLPRGPAPPSSPEPAVTPASGLSRSTRSNSPRGAGCPCRTLSPFRRPSFPLRRWPGCSQGPCSPRPPIPRP